MTGRTPGVTTRPTSLRVVEAVASDRELDPTELEPLYRAIDPDSLDRIVRTDQENARRSETRLTFTFADRRVSVGSDGSIDVASTRDGYPDRTGSSTDRSTMHPGERSESETKHPTD